MNKYHQEILKEIKRAAGKNPHPKRWFDTGKYMGTAKPMYNITNPQIRIILKNWIKEHKDLTLKQLEDFLDSLFKGESHTERGLGGKILEYLPKLRRQTDPENIDKWLTGAEGWGEVDSLCQSTFSSKEVSENWTKWKKLLNKLVLDKDIHKRRASLVLLVKPVRGCDDSRLMKMAFENLDKLKGERDILITKAVSWLLRDMVKNYKKAVEEYLDKNMDILPKIALRETRNKLSTGKK